MSRFYDPRTGKRVDSIPKKNGGGTKSPNINDAIAMRLVPSCTTITDLVSKPFLLTWLQQQAFDSAWGSANTPMSKDEAFAYYTQQSAIARDKGSTLHDKMSRLESCPQTEKVLAWIGERKYSETLHEIEFATNAYGGTIDFLGVVENRTVDLLDFKFVTKARPAYDTELWQLSAYRNATVNRLNYEVRSMMNLYIHQDTGELLSVKEWTFHEHQRGLATFLQILELWQHINNYNILKGERYHE